MALFAAIMAGGGATRLWPLSRRRLPKWRLRDLDRRDAAAVIDVGNPAAAKVPEIDKRTSVRAAVRHSLLLQAYDRAAEFAAGKIAVVTSAEQVEHVRDEVGTARPCEILAEPSPKDTAGAMAFACAWALTHDDDPDLIVLPGDAVLENPARFAKHVADGQQLARREGAIVTFGIKPRYPATGFGYIQAGGPASCGEGCRQVKSFTEKPTREKAFEYMKDGNYFWNAGIFVWRVKDVVGEFAEQLPGHAKAIEAMVKILNAYPSGPEGRPNPSATSELAPVFQSMTKISFDFGIMEHARKVGVVPMELAWDDVGSYSALAARIPENLQDNRATLLTYTSDAEGCTVLTGHGSTKKVVALVGVHDITIVETPDALVVIKSQQDQEIKKIVDKLREHGLDHLL